ncbi:MAG: DNA/RNA non-specific endonuclease [Bacteroidales bacterium]|nr:DNA/RNA non-specific endonuclease [Bacteroidales bacterium]
MKIKLLPLILSACVCLSSQCKQKFTERFNEREPKVEVTDSKLEYPAFAKEDDVIEHIGYTTAYNHSTLTPNWVAYELTATAAAGTVPRSDEFAQDEALEGRQADLSDYRGSGYDRGHMAPAADMKWSEEAMLESFLLTNMCPQVHAMNAGCWETTEKMGRRIANQYGNVWIVCGPIYDECEQGTIGANKVAVPDAFFKAFLINTNGQYSSIAFIMKNSEEPQNLKASSMTVDALETIIHRDLFHNLPDDVENEIEAKIVKKHWGI